ncbi:MAG: hypothetical protein JSS10_01470 [Verrucomicrobia bacterium]|nr:hypothetical protein [Verrucomicrobiota bacterium]
MTAPIRCLSSHLMSYLVTWRNPQGREEGWIFQRETFPGFVKVSICQIGFSAVAVTAAVESIAYGALSLLALTVYRLTDRPFEYTVSLLQSSSFTTLWAVADLIFNWFFPNLLTHESLARAWGQMLNPTSIRIRRLQDQLYVADFEARIRAAVHGGIHDPILQGLARQGADVNQVIQEGAAFITEHLINGADSETLEKFKIREPDILPFIVTKAFYIYIFGSKNSEQIAQFFKNETQALILEMRSKYTLSDEVKQELTNTMKDLASFEKGVVSKEAQTVFNEVRKVAMKELQGLSMFVSHCWDKASANLPSEAAS